MQHIYRKFSTTKVVAAIIYQPKIHSQRCMQTLCALHKPIFSPPAENYTLDTPHLPYLTSFFCNSLYAYTWDKQEFEARIRSSACTRGKVSNFPKERSVTCHKTSGSKRRKGICWYSLNNPTELERRKQSWIISQLQEKAIRSTIELTKLF